MLVFYYTKSPAHALVPAIPTSYQAASAVLQVSGGDPGLYYAMKPADSTTHTVDANGNIYRKSETAWVDLGADGKTPTLKQKNITAKMTYAQIQAIVAAHPSDYPLTKSALFKDTYPGYPDLNNHIEYTAGSKVRIGSKCVTLTYIEQHWAWCPYALPSDATGGYKDNLDGTVELYEGPMTVNLPYGGSFSNSYWINRASYAINTPPPPVSTPVPASAAANNLTGSSSGGSAKSQYQAELDKAMQDPSYVPTFTDDSTGLAYIPPASIPSQNQLCMYDGGAYNDSNCTYHKDTGSSTDNITCTQSAANLKSGNYHHSQSVITKPERLSFDLSYNSLESLDIPLGRGWTHTYNLNLMELSGRINLKLSDGDIINFVLSGSTYLPTLTSNDTSTIVKNSDSSYTRTFESGLTQTFNSTGQLTALTDANGNTTTLTYAGTDLSTITDATGRNLTITSSGGRINSISDPAGNSTTFAYNGNLLSSVTDPAGNSWQYTYDENGKMSQKTDPAGNQSSNVYDDTGKNSSSTDPEGRSKSISYNITTNTSTITEKDGGIWIRTYDYTLNAPTATTDPLGNTSRYTYDSNGNMLTSTDPLGNTTSYTYDTSYNLLTETDPLGKVTSYTYNILGQVLTKTDPAGITTNSYDGKGNLLQRMDPTGAKTVFSYDTTGKLLTVTDPRNNVTTYAYDAYNNLASMTLPTGAVTRFTYDASGNVLTVTNAAHKVTTYTYDNMNRLMTVTDPLNNVTTYGYDKLGNRTSQTDANGAVTTFKYNYRGQMMEAKDALGSATTYGYGPTGCPSCGGGVDKLTALTDARGQTTGYQYDVLGRLTQETDPLNKLTAYAYDAAGNLTTKTDANGAATTYAYDALRRLTGKSYPGGATQTYTYDTAGRLATAANADVTYAYAYDVAGRITGVTDSRGYSINYEYDAISNRTRMILLPTTPDERITSYAYDNANRLQTITSTAGTFTYGYDSLGRRSSLTYPNQISTSYAYDDKGQLTGLACNNGGTSIAAFNYTLDKVGNRLSKSGTVNETYSYDAVYRLLQTVKPKESEKYTYDAVGNRLTGPGAKDISYLYNAGNQMTKGRQFGYVYDNNGNQTTRALGNSIDKSWTLTWDYENRLKTMEQVKGAEKRTVSFKYDPQGRRIEKKLVTIKDGVTKTSTYTYVYDNDNIALEILVDGGNAPVKTFYIHGPGTDEHLALERGGSFYYYHADGLGSITAITDQSKSIVQSYTYDSFGMVKPANNTFNNSYTFTAREWDKETGLYYYRARYYDPMEGRFVSKDPIGFKGGINVYAYTSNNPTNLKDPLGLAPKFGDCELIKDQERASKSWFAKLCKESCAQAILTCNSDCNQLMRFKDKSQTDIDSCKSDCKKSFDKCNSGQGFTFPDVIKKTCDKED